MLLGFLGCASSKPVFTADEGVLPPASLSRSTGVVVEEGVEQPLARGVVLRATFEKAVFVALVPRARTGPFRVLAAGETLPATELGREGELLVLAVDRGRLDLRPLDVAPGAPSPGAALWVVPPPRATRTEGGPLAGRASEGPPRGRAASPEVWWLAAAPEEGERDDRAPALRAREERGGLVLDTAGKLQGFVADPDGELPRFLVASGVATRVEPIVLAPAGAELVRADDGFLEHSLRVDSIDGLPRLPDEAAPMLVLEAHVAGELAGRVEVTPGRNREDALLIARDVGPVVFKLVALDRSLAKGETREELSATAELPRLRERMSLELVPRPEALARYGSEGIPRATRIGVSLSVMDPDAQAGPSRALVGATPLALGRLADGWLDLKGGRATHFFLVDAEGPEPVAAVLLRRRPLAALELQAFSPGFDGCVLKVAAEPFGPRIVMAAGRLPRGRTYLRLRQTGGEGATAFELLVARTVDAPSLVGPIFRLVSREASSDGTAFLDSDAFVDDVAKVLEGARFARDQVARALVDELGNRVLVARRLALLLLERHFRPTRTVLEEAFASNGAGSADAGLILAELDPRDERLRPVLYRASRDPDPTVRARSVRIAARSGDPKLALDLATALENDPAPIVARAVEAARLAARK